MRIMHLLNHSLAANGHVEMAVDLACEQAARGHDVMIASGPGDFDDLLKRHGVEFFMLPLPAGAKGNLRFLVAVLRLVRRWKPDIVNAHMVKSALAARAARAISRFGLVTTLHNSFDDQATLMRCGARVIAVSNAVNEEMAARGIPPRKLRTVHNGTIGGKRRPMWPASIKSLEHPNIVTVAGLHPRKGIAELIDAFAAVLERQPAAHLYLVGDGPMRREYEDRVASIGIGDSVHFEGHQRDPREYLGDADVFVLASHQEPFGLVISEARQMGCAIVLTDVGGTPEALGGRDRGILVPAKNPEELAAAIVRLLENDDERELFAQAASGDLDYCTVARMCSDTLAVYAELAG